MNTVDPNFENLEMRWKPIPFDYNKQRKTFISILEEKYNVQIGGYWDLQKWSVEHLEEFWAEIWDFAGIVYSQKFKEVIDAIRPMNAAPEWFVGARLNFAENLLKNKDERIALIVTGEDGRRKKRTYNEVYEKAQLYAAAFRTFGIKKGDIVTCFMSNREEAIFAMLGVVSLGALWTGALPFLGAEAALNRFKLVNPKIMITVDRFRNNGEEVEMLHKVQKIAAELQSLEKIIIVPSTEESTMKDISRIRNGCFLDEFLELGFGKDGSVPPITFEQLPFSHPVFISYTSGTTGLPKAVVHGCGMLLETAKVHSLRRQDSTNQNFLSMSPVGWASWNMTLSYLFAGITVILYEGVPFFLSPTYLWDLVDDFKLSTLFLSPSVLDELEKRNYIPMDKHSLESLSIIVCGSSVVKPNNYDFVYNKIKKSAIFFSGYGSTELMGSCMTFDPSLPIYKGEIPCAALGFDLDCLDDSGNSVVGEVGELVLKKPAPSLPLGLWGDADGSRFRETYFGKYEDKFVLGDLGIINPITKGIIVCCRSDETLKPKGVRFGSTEIYNIVNLFPEIHDSLCVSQYSRSNNERAVLFVQMRKGHSLSEPLVERIRLAIKEGLSNGHVPELVLETSDIPKMSPKIEQNVPKIVYHPPKYEETQMERFKKMIEKEFKLKFNDYWEFQEWTFKNYPEFWDCVWRFFDILHSKPYSQVYDRKNGFERMEWFKGARLNYAQNLLKYKDSEIAIISTDAEDDTVRISYQQLYDEVNVYEKALKIAGMKKGEKIACYMSNKKEAIFAFLATAAIGGIWCGCLPLLGTKATLSRFEQINPKILFVSGNFRMDSREFNMDEKIIEIAENLPSLQKVVYCPTKLKSKVKISEIRNCVFLSEFLQEAREALQKDPKDLEFEQLPFDYPLCISFTSGTTGAPKGLVHSIGMFIGNLKDYGLHQNCTRSDVLFNQSPNGWISWNMNVNALHLGLSVVMYDGDPFQESPTRFWDLVDKFGITSLFMWSSTIDDMDINSKGPSSKHSLKSLRQILPNGSPAKPSAFDFLSERVKPGLFCSPAYGTTEVFGLLSGVNHNLPVYRGEIQLLSLGMDVRILDEQGNSQIGQRGEAVLANPYPALPIQLVNDENKQKVTDMYLAEHPGYWNIGDDAWQNPVTKGFVVYGRSDESMDPKGARYNCSDIYFALEGFPGLKDSVVVSQYNQAMDERVILFVKMFPGHTLTDEMKGRINQTIEHHLTYEHIPDIIMEAPDIPYNLTGKKLNGLVKKLINKKPIANVDVVINPSSVEFFKTLELGEF